jgi:hypothetical protein
MNEPGAVTISKKGWLYVTDEGNSVVVEFPPRSLQPSRREIRKGVWNPEGTAHYPVALP